jgi:hypothetical protein
MSELSIGQLRGLTVNSNTVTVPAGHTLYAPGHVIQIVQVVKPDTFSTSSTSFTDVTGLSASITPKNANSKVLVLANVLIGYNTGQTPQVTLTDGANNNLVLPTTPGSRTPTFSGIYANNAGWMLSQGFNLLHSPSTTSSFTYKIRIRANAGVAQYINRSGDDTDGASFGRGVSTITLMEIAQ